MNVCERLNETHASKVTCLEVCGSECHLLCCCLLGNRREHHQCQKCQQDQQTNPHDWNHHWSEF